MAIYLRPQVFHHSSKKTTKVLPKQPVEKETPNTVLARLQPCRKLLAPFVSETPKPSLIVKELHQQCSLTPPRVQHLLTFTSASLFIVSRRAVWNAVISKQQVAGMLAL